MTISWYGEGCFKIQSGEVTLLTDPFDASTGLTPPRSKADAILKTINPFPPQHQEADSFIVSGTGEYNLKGVNIDGFPLPAESTDKFLKTAYLVETENIKLCFLGHLSEYPEPAALEHIDEVDILFIPAGGKPFIDQKSAVKVIKNLEPSIVIPSFFKVPGLKRPSSDLKHFFEELNHKPAPAEEKLVVKRKDLAELKHLKIAILTT